MWERSSRPRACTNRDFRWTGFGQERVFTASECLPESGHSATALILSDQNPLPTVPSETLSGVLTCDGKVAADQGARRLRVYVIPVVTKSTHDVPTQLGVCPTILMAVDPPRTPDPQVRHCANQFVLWLAGNALVSGLWG